MVGPQTDTILIDFSPKGGPKNLIGQYDGSGIRFPDGNRWVKVGASGSSPDLQSSEPNNLASENSSLSKLIPLHRTPGCPASTAETEVSAVLYMCGHLRSFPYAIADSLLKLQCSLSRQQNSASGSSASGRNNGWNNDGGKIERAGAQVLTIIVTREKNMLPSDAQWGDENKPLASDLVTQSSRVLDLMAGTFCSPVFAR